MTTVKTETNVKQIKLNKLSQEQYLAALNSGQIHDDEVYMTPDTSIEQFEHMPVASFEFQDRLVQFIGEEESGEETFVYGYFYKCVALGTEPETYEWQQINIQPETVVVDNVTTQSSTSALSANMGYELQQQISQLQGLGRYLSVWDCTTGLPQTDPTVIPYEYRAGDYYIVGNVVKAEPESLTGTQIVGEGLSLSVDPDTSRQNRFYTDLKGLIGEPLTDVDIYAVYSKNTVTPTKSSSASGDTSVVTLSRQGSAYVKQLEVKALLESMEISDYESFIGTSIRVHKEGSKGKILVYGVYRSTEGYDTQTAALEVYTRETKDGEDLVEGIKKIIEDEWYIKITGDLVLGPVWSCTVYKLSIGDSGSPINWVYDINIGGTRTGWLDPFIIEGTPEEGDVVRVSYRTEKINYRPDGTEYTSEPSTTIEDREVSIDDSYIYDGLVWHLLSNAQKEITFGSIVGSPYDNVELANALNSKVSKVEDASIVYGTDENGEQTTYDITTFGQIDNVAVHGVDQTITDKRVDLSVVEQYDETTIPAASVDLLGRVIQYIGQDTNTLTHNYFYECVEVTNTNFTIWTDNEGDLSHFYEPQYYNKETFENYVHPTESTTITLCCKIISEDPWEVMWYLEDDPNPENPTEARPSWYGWEYTPDDLDRTTGANNTDQIKFIYTTNTTYEWIRKDVQPNTAVWGSITGTLSDQTDLQEALDAKQDTLTAGSGISIDENNIISATFSESYFRGKFSTWDTVPTDYRNYYPDYTGSTKPTRTDYMVVEDPSSYVKPGLPIQIYNEPKPTSVAYARFVFGATDVTLGHDRVQDAGETGVTIGTVGSQIKVTYNTPLWKITPLDVPIIVDGVEKPVGEVAFSWGYGSGQTEVLVKELNFAGQGGYVGTWRFSYQSDDWDATGKNGWYPEYQIEDILPIASDTVAGITKLYTTTGSNTDGTMDQNSITTELGQRVLQVTEFPEASASNEGQLVQFIGTDGTGVTGWFYTSTEYQIPYSLTVEGDSDVTVTTYNTETFISQLSDPTVDSTLVFTYDGTDWKDSDSNVVDLTDWGITISGTPVNNSTITGTYIAPSTGYRWVQTDTQPTTEYHESFFRGPFHSWSIVPDVGHEDQYYADFYGSHRPGLTDYIVITDPLDYISEETEIIHLLTHATGGNDASIDVTITSTGEFINYLFTNTYGVWTKISNTDFYITYARPETGGGWGIKNDSTPFAIDGVVYPVGSVYYWNYTTRVDKSVNGYHVYRGMWRFSYASNSWDSEGKNGWRPEYQIENVLPIADEQTLGIAKLYQSTGTHTDGAISQKAATDHINDKNNPHEVTKAQVGLENVDNTSDADKPISTATQTALDGKVDHYSSLPTAGQNHENKIVQYIGNTDSSSDLYQGFFYVCKAQGTDPETYAWEILQNVQPTAKPIIWVTYEDYEDSGE